jgi:hypothetical protein
MSAQTRPGQPVDKRRDSQPRLRDIAFAVIAILAMLAVLAAATIVPFARAARVRAHASPAVRGFRPCLPAARVACAAARSRHEGHRA